VSNLLKKEKGFTLIEIVLVLAIAGLILLIVFLAVSGAQKARRDQQRKSDASRVLSQLEQYASNNGGLYPTSANLAASFTAKYITGNNYNDPSSGGTYTIAWYSAGTPALGTVEISTNATCANGTLSGAGNGLREVGVEVGTEQGGSYCVDNH
jgi:prepilin-type N-terminal cleavage/methylation domain-containing protein